MYFGKEKWEESLENVRKKWEESLENVENR